ncbi:MAG TPA: hypothetical protein VHB74_08370 [Devosia sp.]|nr:hypothetical protein [Devosia sp.]
MSKNSAFARVVELTRTFSPFERPEADESEDETDAVVATAMAEEAAEPGDEPAAALQIAPPKPQPLTLEARVTTARPALTQVTVVAPDKVEDVDDRQAVMDEAIESIEADIASLLASFENNEEATGDDEPEEATKLLLSELDRLWRADPTIGNGTVH